MERDDRLMTVKELAAYLNLNERTVLKLAADGPMPAVKVGNQWRIRETNLDALLGGPNVAINPRHLHPPPVERAGAAQLGPPTRIAPIHLPPRFSARPNTPSV